MAGGMNTYGSSAVVIGKKPSDVVGSAAPQIPRSKEHPSRSGARYGSPNSRAAHSVAFRGLSVKLAATRRSASCSPPSFQAVRSA